MDTCPNCGRPIEEDTELYVIDSQVVGCGECVEVIYSNENYYTLALQQAQQDYIDNVLWDRRIDQMV